MLVTAVVRKPRRAGRVDVYIDGEVAFDLPRDAARKAGLRPGRFVQQSEIAALVATEGRRAALEAAVALLARRPRSERELRRRLKQRRFTPSLIDATLDRLQALKLVDDAAYARYWAAARDRVSPRSQRMVAQELRTQGVDVATAVDATANISDVDAAYRLASRRARSLSGNDYEAFRNRLAGYLQRRGFGWDVVRATVGRCWREIGGEPPHDDLPEGV